MRKVLLIVLCLLIVGGGSYVYFFYFYRYDEGIKEGVLKSFSRRGTVFKTNEGIIFQKGLRPSRAGGLSTDEFHFSVTDEVIADSLRKCLGKKVIVHYSLYRRHLPWRGENNNVDNKEKGQYIVDRIESVEEINYMEDYY